MVWFLIRLAIDALFSIGLFVLFCWRMLSLKTKRVKHTWEFALPTLLALVLLFQVAIFSGPKMLDALRLVNDSYYVKPIVFVERNRLTGQLLTEQGESFSDLPFSQHLRLGERYIVQYLPRSKFIIRYHQEGEEAPDIPNSTQTSDPSASRHPDVY